MIKLLSFIWTAIKTILTIVLILLLLIIGTQRLSNNKNAIAGFRVFNVVTESMKPEYKVGDALLTKSIKPSEIKVGDNITYMGLKDSFKDKIVTHKVIKIEKNQDGLYFFTTKGIANDVEDPEINESQVFGKVIYKIKSISYLNGVIGNLYGMYFVIIVPLAIIIAIEFFTYGKEDEKNEEESKKVIDDKEDEENDEEDEEKRLETILENSKKEEDLLKQKRKERRNKRREKRRKRS